MIDRIEIDRVKAGVNLKDVIGNDVVWAKEARSYGGTLKGPCPFCGGSDRFHAHPKDGNWWCRQCGRRGDVFGYWMQRYNVSFTEAYRALSLVAGLSAEAESNAIQELIAVAIELGGVVVEGKLCALALGATGGTPEGLVTIPAGRT